MIKAITPREQQVLECIAEGWTSDDIALELAISKQTVKSHTRHILFKMKAKNRAHAVALGYQKGILGASENSSV